MVKRSLNNNLEYYTPVSKFTRKRKFKESVISSGVDFTKNFEIVFKAPQIVFSYHFDFDVEIATFRGIKFWCLKHQILFVK